MVENLNGSNGWNGWNNGNEISGRKGLIDLNSLNGSSCSNDSYLKKCYEGSNNGTGMSCSIW